MEALIYLPILFFSVIVHEVAHGYAALRLGDNTALNMGRLTLNPIPHIDIIGTIILPVMLILRGGIMIGWAKPVPVNPFNFVNPRQDFAKVGAAGPVSNIILAVISTMMIRLIVTFGLAESFFFIIELLAFAVRINILLAVFNLIPVPPLDGSRIVSAMRPAETAHRYQALERYGIFPALIVVFVLFNTGILHVIVGIFSFVLLRFSGLNL